MNRSKVATGLLDLKNASYESVGGSTDEVMRKFVSSFVRPDKQDTFFVNLNRPKIKRKTSEYARYFSEFYKRDLHSVESSLIDWISNRQTSKCYLLWNSSKYDALLFTTGGLLDIELSYFADGYLCNLAMTRVVAVTLDNEILAFERKSESI